MDHSKRNWIALVVSTIITCIFVAILYIFIGGTPAGDMVIGELDLLGFPFTLHNLMHFLFFVGVGQLWVRWLSTHEEKVFLRMSGFLPEEENSIIKTEKELETIRINVGNAAVRGDAFLPDLINTCIIQYCKSHSVSDTLAVLNSNLDLSIHRLDLRYSLTRYIVWAIPTIGFIGTVIGISDSMGELDIIKFMGNHADKVSQFKALTSGLGFAFSTTIVALCLSAVLVFMQNVIQRGEEEVLNQSAKYVLGNFINRLSL